MEKKGSSIAVFLFWSIVISGLVAIVAISYIHSNKAVSFNELHRQLNGERAAAAAATEYWKDLVKQARSATNVVAYNFAKHEETCNEQMRLLAKQRVVKVYVRRN